MANANRYHLLMHNESLPRESQPAPMPSSVATPPRKISSHDLFSGSREIVIEHGGRLYRMRITQNGKLILTA